MKRKERGIVRSDMIHITMCMLSGVREMKSQKLSWAVWRLRKSSIRFLLGRMDQVGKLDGVLNKEHRNVIPDNVPVAFLCVELHGEAANIARQVCRAFIAGHSREAHEGGGLLSCALEDVGLGNVGKRLVVLEIAMRAKAAGVHDPLGDTLMIEVKNLLAKVKIFKRGGAARANL